MISVLILTKNEAQDLPGCLKSVSWCDDTHVYDSYSEDDTVAIALAAGATITQRKFDNWAAHQNWGLANIIFKYQWVLYLDADERVSDELRAMLLLFNGNDNPAVAYEIQRRDFAWNGKWLKYAQVTPYYMRLFRPEKMRYERLVNPVSLPDGPTARIEGFLDHYPFSKGIKVWFSRHLNYAEMEAVMRLNDLHGQVKFLMLKALFATNFHERRYHQKGMFYKLPFRPMIKWVYMVIWRRAFLDGRVGITYATLLAIYEYFIVLKTRELIISGREKGSKKKLAIWLMDK